MKAHRVAIVGIGAEGLKGLSASALALLAGAGVIFGGRRQLDLAAPVLRGELRPWPRPIEAALPEILARRAERVAVLASGDPFWFGIGSLLARAIPPEEMLCLPAPSAFSLAAARLGWALQEVAVISFCGRPLAPLAPLLQPGARILALSADASTPAHVAEFLSARGFGPSAVILMEALGGERERIRRFQAASFAAADIAPLNMLALEVQAAPGARILPLAAGLAEDFFAHDGQISKREIRALTLSALAPRQGELLWDIGAGSGAVGIEWMLRHRSMRAIAIEMRVDRAQRVAANAVCLGVPELAVKIGTAPEALADLPPPDAVFVGGGGHDPAVLESAWTALRPGGRMVVNAVTLETEATLLSAWRRFGGELRRFSVERAEPLGGFHSYRPALTVTQWCVEKR